MTSVRRGACDPTLLFLLLIAEELRHLCCHPAKSSLARPSVHAARPSRNAAMTRALTKCTYLPPHPSKHPLTTRTAGAAELAERHSPGPRECPGGPASASSPLPHFSRTWRRTRAAEAKARGRARAAHRQRHEGSQRAAVLPRQGVGSRMSEPSARSKPRDPHATRSLSAAFTSLI